MKKALFILLLAAATGCHKKSEFVAPEPEGDRVAVGFALGGVSVSAKPASRADAPAAEELAVGTTVRVLAFQRVAGAVSADITADKFVAEATYVVVENTKDDGTKVRVLEACNVNPATGAVDNANTADPAQIRLRADKYDFYALTPATAIASPWEVSVSHGVDHASSVTKDVAIASNLSSGSPSYTQTVKLDMLMRRCSQISFAIDRKAENVTKTTIKSAKFTKIAPSPAVAKLCEALPLPAVNDGSFEMKGDIFSSVDGVAYKLAGKAVVLPKSESAFRLDMTINFNDASTNKDVFADIPAMSLDPSYQYCFLITLKGGDLSLTLLVMDWDAEYTNDVNIGDWFHGSVELGTWSVADWDTDLGA